MSVIHCVQCNSIYPETGVPYRCPECGGIYDFREFPQFNQDEINKCLPGMWQYRHAFGLPDAALQITLGEGHTPLVWTNYDGISIALKLEMLNPSGSYKDRGSSVLLSQLMSRGVVQAVEDSSGNAGASFAAYAARAGIISRIFVPESASGPKRNQIEQYGAELVSVPGPRSEAARAVLEEVKQGAVYASHAFLPFGLVGIASISYEIWEQLSTIPGSVIIPVGHGSLMLGIMRGFKALHTAGIVEKVPYFVGVQAGACAPVVAEYMKRKGCETTVYENPTVAEGVRVRYPVRAKTILDEIQPDGGTFIAIDEERILPAYKQLARRGFFVEPTSAIPWAALEILKGKLPEPIVMILTGSGLKYNTSS